MNGTDATTAQAASGTPLSEFEQLGYAREILRIEGEAVLALAERLGQPFVDATDLLLGCTGNVIVTGMGKAGLVGQKLAATFGSTGTSSHFLHPGEAVHGDLGRIHRHDVVLALSFSGQTEEMTRLLPPLRDMGIPVVAMTGNPSSRLAEAARVTLDLGPLREACALGLAPSTSTTAMLALGDALALVISRRRAFAPEDFARFHPAGSLGRKLAKVEDLMRPLAACRVAEQAHSVRDVLVTVSQPGRRSGAVMLVDDRGRLRGIFTDSDLARLLETKRETQLDGPIREVMTSDPVTVQPGTSMADAVRQLSDRKLSELPVVDADNHPVGMLDITDVVGWPVDRDNASEESGTDVSPDVLPFSSS